MWLRRCFQEQASVRNIYEKNIADNLCVGPFRSNAYIAYFPDSVEW